ncbi:MAG: hypothetical protein JW762_10985 [Dehalococcoidales bacterium]|nr:hypothetical protein [Dehalococcoidales bacterium]
MVSKTKESPTQTIFDLQESLNELIKYVYLSGLQDGKALWNKNEESIDKVSNERISKIISVLNLN